MNDTKNIAFFTQLKFATKGSAIPSLVVAFTMTFFSLSGILDVLPTSDPQLLAGKISASLVTFFERFLVFYVAGLLAIFLYVVFRIWFSLAPFRKAIGSFGLGSSRKKRLLLIVFSAFLESFLQVPILIFTVMLACLLEFLGSFDRFQSRTSFKQGFEENMYQK